MKQHLLPSDLDKLTDSGKQKLREWWKPSEGDQVMMLGSHLFNIETKVLCYGEGMECECQSPYTK